MCVYVYKKRAGNIFVGVDGGSGQDPRAGR